MINDEVFYRFSIVSTNALSDSIDIEKYERAVTDANSKYAGYSGEF